MNLHTHTGELSPIAMKRQELEAYDYARKKAWNIHRKLPSTARNHTDVEDIVQNLMMEFIQNRHRYDPAKGPFGPWINEVMKNQGKDEITGSWTIFNRDRDMPRDADLELATEFGEDGIGELAIVDVRSPEMECIAYYEEEQMAKKVTVLRKEVRELCTQFGIKFDKDDYPKSLAMVLAKTLNQMPDEEFRRLPYETQTRLARYGDALTANSLQVTTTGKVKSKGIVAIVRECVQNGVLDFEEVKKVLDIRKAVYSPDSVRTLIWDEKKRAGLPIEKKQTGIMAKMTELFNRGKGVTTPAEMMAALENLKLQYAPSTVRTHVQQLRKQYKITSK